MQNTFICTTFCKVLGGIKPICLIEHLISVILYSSEQYDPWPTIHKPFNNPTICSIGDVNEP